MHANPLAKIVLLALEGVDASDQGLSVSLRITLRSQSRVRDGLAVLESVRRPYGDGSVKLGVGMDRFLSGRVGLIRAHEMSKPESFRALTRAFAP